jgi:hypothetical protein
MILSTLVVTKNRPPHERCDRQRRAAGAAAAGCPLQRCQATCRNKNKNIDSRRGESDRVRAIHAQTQFERADTMFGYGSSERNIAARSEHAEKQHAVGLAVRSERHFRRWHERSEGPSHTGKKKDVCRGALVAGLRWERASERGGESSSYNILRIANAHLCRCTPQQAVTVQQRCILKGVRMDGPHGSIHCTSMRSCDKSKVACPASRSQIYNYAAIIVSPTQHCPLHSERGCRVGRE